MTGNFSGDRRGSEKSARTKPVGVTLTCGHLVRTTADYAAAVLGEHFCGACDMFRRAAGDEDGSPIKPLGPTGPFATPGEARLWRDLHAVTGNDGASGPPTPVRLTSPGRGGTLWRARTIAKPPDGEHLWTVSALWRLADPDALILDEDSPLTVEGPHCLLCDEPYRAGLTAARCAGVP